MFRLGCLYCEAVEKIMKNYKFLFCIITVFVLMVVGCQQIKFQPARKSFGLWEALILIVCLLLFVWMFYLAYRSIKNLKKGQEKARLMEEDILPKFISKFGKVISIVYDKGQVKFERNGMLFDVASKGDGRENSDVIITTVQFSLPDNREKFFIHHKSYFSSKTYEACESVQVVMPNDFVFYSLNPQYLLDLLQSEKIRDEIYKYQKKFSREFSVAFVYGSFTVTWHRHPDDGTDEISWDLWKDETPNEEVRRLAQICQTAVVFYDELTKK